MTTMRSLASVFAMAAVICLMQSGYAPADSKSPPGSSGNASPTSTVVLAPPVIKVYEISAGGVPEQMDEWSTLEKKNVTKALFSHFSSSRTKITMLEPDSDTDRELREVFALFAVLVQSNAINPHLASLGSLESILQRSGGDALLLVQGEDQFATTGKMAVNILGTITGVAASAFTGVAIIPRMEGVILRMALAERNGTIIWHKHIQGKSDLRDMDNCTNYVNTLLESFPRLDK